MVPLKPLAIQAFDNRFDMPVPYDHDMLNAVEEIMLSPPSAGGCEIVVTGAPLTPPATFHAEIFFAPPFDARLRMLIRHADFSFLFHEREADFETTRSEEHTSELQSLMRLPYAVFCLTQ